MAQAKPEQPAFDVIVASHFRVTSFVLLKDAYSTALGPTNERK